MWQTFIYNACDSAGFKTVNPFSKFNVWGPKSPFGNPFHFNLNLLNSYLFAIANNLPSDNQLNVIAGSMVDPRQAGWERGSAGDTNAICC